jgi:gluconate 5-dehydrogenase
MPSYFDLNNRVALVTGASRGLGLAMAEALAEVGATVILNGRDANTLKTAADRIRDRGLKAETSAFDVIRNGVTFILGRAGELEHARWRSRPRLF